MTSEAGFGNVGQSKERPNGILTLFILPLASTLLNDPQERVKIFLKRKNKLNKELQAIPHLKTQVFENEQSA